MNAMPMPILFLRFALFNFHYNLHLFVCKYLCHFIEIFMFHLCKLFSLMFAAKKIRTPVDYLPSVSIPTFICLPIWLRSKWWHNSEIVCFSVTDHTEHTIMLLFVRCTALTPSICFFVYTRCSHVCS